RTSSPGCGAPKNGSGLLAGLLRCRRCGRKLRVGYSGPNGDIPRYQCDRGIMDTAEPRCISFGGMVVEQHVVAEALRVLQPAAIEAAVLAAERKRTTQDDLLRAIELELKAARYEAARAEKVYEGVDAVNRRGGEELEAGWNTALTRVHELEQRLERERLQAAPGTVADRKSMTGLARDLERVWNSPIVEQRTKKR